MNNAPPPLALSAQEALRSFLAAIVESSDDAIIGTTPDGRILSWNQGAEQIYGYIASEIVGQPLALLAVPERGDEIQRFLERIHRGERIRHFETLHLRKDGRVISVALTLSPIVDSHGRILGASTIARDETRRIRYEESLREAEQKYRLLFAAETDAIVVSDAESGRIVDFNEAAMRLYDYPPEAFSRLGLDDLILSRPNRPAPGGTAENGSVLRVPLEYHRRRDGSAFPAERSLSVFSWQGRSMQVGIVRDVSELQRGRELDQALRMASDIQKHLLPRRPPDVPAFDVAAGSRYCEATGGDYYDFIPLNGFAGERLGCLVGDVSGHGIAAALLMAMAKGGIWAGVERFGEDLEGLFRSLNNHLVRHFEDDRFMTLFFVWLDPEARSFCWTSAAHGPVLLYRKNLGMIEELPTSGPPLGILADCRYPASGPCCLTPGDLLLIGTDGLWEARNDAGEMFGVQRLRQVLANWADKPAAAIYGAIIDKIRAFRAPLSQDDDMTLMVIKAR